MKHRKILILIGLVVCIFIYMCTRCAYVGEKETLTFDELPTEVQDTINKIIKIRDSKDIEKTLEITEIINSDRDIYISTDLKFETVWVNSWLVLCYKITNTSTHKWRLISYSDHVGSPVIMYKDTMYIPNGYQFLSYRQPEEFK